MNNLKFSNCFFKINSELKCHLFYLFESPETATAFEVFFIQNFSIFLMNHFGQILFQCISRIIEYFDNNLALYREIAFKVNFERILKIAWLRILTEIKIYLKNDTSSQVVYYSNNAFIFNLN
jgi:hypothetical protein